MTAPSSRRDRLRLAKIKKTHEVPCDDICATAQVVSNDTRTPLSILCEQLWLNRVVEHQWQSLPNLPGISDANPDDHHSKFSDLDVKQEQVEFTNVRSSNIDWQPLPMPHFAQYQCKRKIVPAFEDQTHSTQSQSLQPVIKIQRKINGNFEREFQSDVLKHIPSHSSNYDALSTASKDLHTDQLKMKTVEDSITSNASDSKSKLNTKCLEYQPVPGPSGIGNVPHKKTESLNECPLCLLPFTTSLSQIDMDSHIATCLAAADDDDIGW